MPSAFGARDFLLVNARIIIDAMNGIMLYMFCVQPRPARNGIELAIFAGDLNSAKNTAAKKIRNGFHCPKIITARARKPKPRLRLRTLNDNQVISSLVL